MRISEEMAEFITREVHTVLPSADVLLFGSRADDAKRGGDIDILVIGDRALTYDEKGTIKREFWKRFDEQKLDIASFARDEKSAFKEVALENALSLT